jgi:hypothetical protein
MKPGAIQKTRVCTQLGELRTVDRSIKDSSTAKAGIGDRSDAEPALAAF